MHQDYKQHYHIGGDLEVNRLGYGAMRITGKGIWGPPANKEEAIRVLKTAIESGVNFIDTADSYGPFISEELIAEALHPYPDDLVIATKGGLLRTGPDQWPVDGSPAHLNKALEGSLKRLKLESIDLYQLHRIDSRVPVEETFGFLKRAQEEGKIKHLGLSEVNIQEIKKASNYFKVVSVQNKYSVDNRRWEDVLEYCRENGIAFIPWYPLNAGKLDSMKILEKIAGIQHCTVHQVAISWLLHHAENILLIPGTSSVAHLKENMESISVVLSPDDLQMLGKLSK